MEPILSFPWVASHSPGVLGLIPIILATNPINLSVVLGVLIFFGKGVCASSLYQEIGWIQPAALFFLCCN